VLSGFLLLLLAIAGGFVVPGICISQTKPRANFHKLVLSLPRPTQHFLKPYVHKRKNGNKNTGPFSSVLFCSLLFSSLLFSSLLFSSLLFSSFVCCAYRAWRSDLTRQRIHIRLVHTAYVHCTGPHNTHPPTYSTHANTIHPAWSHDRAQFMCGFASVCTTIHSKYLLNI
jgi:hypothetical protein